jgi:hypothetical protein
MVVHAYDNSGKNTGTIQVPVKLAYKDKILAALRQNNHTNPNAKRDNEVTLPMISIAWTGLSFDPERAHGIRAERKLYVEYEDGTATGGYASPQQHIDLQTVPYKLTFDVTLWASYMDHLVQLIENIVPFLHPEMYVSYYEKGLGIERKAKITKVGESPKFSTDLSDSDLRNKILQWNLQFEMECNFYKPEEPIGKPIKRVINRFYAAGKGIEKAEVIETQVANSASIGPSSNYCYYDLDQEIVSWIRDYTLTEDVLPTELEPALSCGSIGELTPPPEIKPYEYQYSMTVLDGLTSSVNISSANLNYHHNPLVFYQQYNKTDTTSVVSVSGDAPYGFTVTLSQIPPSGASIIWSSSRIY